MSLTQRKAYFRFRRIGLYHLVWAILAFFTQHAVAASSIDTQASQWVVNHIEQIGKEQGWQSLHLQPTITLFTPPEHLQPCSTALQFSAPLTPALVTRFPLLIQCDAAHASWRVRAQVNVELRLAAVIAARAINPGSVVTAEDIQFAPLTFKPGMRVDVVTQLNDALQMTVKRSVAEGQPLRESFLSTPRLMSRNQPITLVIQQEGLELSTGGIALQNGGKGATIRVKNSSSGRVLSGTIINGQQVLIHAIE
ncbi:flagellar basal body P-ring formation chaperone FlgA [Rosenbergiella australiborealis]|nr:flagellar basal body P-ring formation chaperone FlgA [Rosenbergiella australiborealis]